MLISLRVGFAIAAATAGVILSGCGGRLMPTPNIYAGGAYQLYGDLNPTLRSPEVDLLYVTDRAPSEAKRGRFGYGHGRSRSMTFGSCVVGIGDDVSWEVVLRESTSSDRSEKLPLRVDSVTELGRFPETPVQLVKQDGRLAVDPRATAKVGDAETRFRQEVRRRLELSPQKDVFIFVHGFHNSFDYAAAVMAEFWHFGGRLGVPILYSWPAGAPGLLRGYAHDTESGEFTIPHLKHFLRLVTSVGEAQRIHLIAHSRGTDVLTSALREVLAEELAAGRDPRRTLRIGNVVLASPDIDLDIFFQRFFGEAFYRVAQHLTIYVSPRDKAIGLSRWLNTDRRVGSVRPADFTEDEAALLQHIGTYDIIEATVRTSLLGHSYYHSNPAVSSDLILLLRYGARAGSAERPLKHAIARYWLLDDEAYPKAAGGR